MTGVATLTFHVNGIPTPQGSKKGIVAKAFSGGKPLYKDGRPVLIAQVIDDNSDELMIWRGTIIDAARRQMGNLEPFEAIAIDMLFSFPRPGNHYGKHGLLKSAPTEKTTKPDLDKLVRATYDALEGAGVVRSDGGIVESHERKVFGTPGLDVTIREVVVHQQQEMTI